MSRRSPRSYISRTFPDATRGRSDTGGMRRRLLGLEDDDRDDAVALGLPLVVVVLRVYRGQPRPVRRALLVGRPAGPHPPPVAPDLDLGVGRAHQVVEPRRVLVGAALGGHDDEPVAVGQVEHRRDARLAAAPADVVQQQHRRLADVVAEPPAGGPVGRDVDARHDVHELPEQRVGWGRLHARDSMVPAAQMRWGIDSAALRDTWRTLVATRGLVWAVGVLAVLRLGFEPTARAPADVRPFGWL